MATETPILYTKLPGRGKRAWYSGVATLWLGPDHLLQVEMTLFTETYKRFYFNDIQGVTMRRTNTARIFLAAGIALAFVGLVTVVGGAVALDASGATKNSQPEYYGLLGMLLTFGLLLLFGGLFVALFNWIRGPRCVCHIQTAVQEERLPALCRVKKATRALEQIARLVEARQGALPVAELERLGVR